MSIIDSATAYVVSSSVYEESIENKDFWPLYLPLGFISIFFVVPILYISLLSFSTYDPTENVVWELTVENWVRVLSDEFYRGFIWYTIRLAAVVTLLCILLGYPVGYLTAKASPRVRSTILFLVLLPLMIGIVIRTYGWMAILGQDGIVSRATEALLGEPILLLGSTEAVIIGLVGVFIPFMILPVQSTIQDVNPELEKAARDLGANKLTSFYKVTLPLSLPGVLAGVIFCFTLTMSAIVTPQLLGGRGDLTIGVLMYDTALSIINWPLASTLSIIILVINIGFVYVYIRVSQIGAKE